MKYKFLEHTADVMFEVYGKTLNEIFENSGMALFEVQANLKKIKPKTKKLIKLENGDAGNLLFDFLEELIYLKDAKKMFFSKFKIKIKENLKKKLFVLNGEIFGEKIDVKKQELKSDVKAVTFYMFKLEKTEKGYKARIVLDI